MTKQKRPFLNATKSVADKFEEINKELPSQELQQEQELIIQPKHMIQISSAVEKEIKARRYVKERKQTGIKLDVDLHQDFRIACIRDGRTMEEILEELVSDFVRKSKRIYEK